MSTTASADFICSKCKKGYTWYADFAGKVARCTCGAVIQFPFTDPKPKDPLAIPYLPRTIEENTGNGPAPMELPKNDLDQKILAERQALGEYYDDAPVPVDPVRDIHVPFALLAIGLLLLSWEIADLVESLNYSGFFFVAGYVFGKTVELGLSLLGVMIAGKVMGIYLGKAKLAFFKLTALHIAPSAIGTLIAEVFRIKAWQTLVCVACILLVKVLAVMCIAGAVLGLFMAGGGMR
jgi:hypothetical protein